MGNKPIDLIKILTNENITMLTKRGRNIYFSVHGAEYCIKYFDNIAYLWIGTCRIVFHNLQKFTSGLVFYLNGYTVATIYFDEMYTNNFKKDPV